MKASALALLLAMGIQGCSTFTKPMEQPVIEEKLNPRWLSKGTVGTLSLTPERRVVLVNFRNNRFCAEAPTEVGTDLASAIDASVELSKGNTAKIGTALKSAINAQNSVLNRRTQGMQLFLANSYIACQMYMNGGIDEKQLLEMQFQALKVVEPLINNEISLMYQKSGETDGKPKVPPPQQSASPDQIRKDVEKTVNEILEQKSAKPEEAPKPDSPQ